MRTSVRWPDIVLKQHNLYIPGAASSEQLKEANAILDIPLQQLRLSGVILIKSTEPGRYLVWLCRTLTTLVEVDLHRVPDLVVVERGEVQRLISETDVSGLSLEICGATRLVQSTVRFRAVTKPHLPRIKPVTPGEFCGSRWCMKTLQRDADPFAEYFARKPPA